MSAQEAPALEDAFKDAAAFRTIGEAAAELDLKTHVLRFWETKFEALAPLKRADGRRYYRPEDMETLRTLKQLLHVQGLTIRGAIRVLSGQDAGEEGDEGDAQLLNAEVRSDVAEPGTVHALQWAIEDAAGRGEFGPGQPAAPGARDQLLSVVETLQRFKTQLDTIRLAG